MPGDSLVVWFAFFRISLLARVGIGCYVLYGYPCRAICCFWSCDVWFLYSFPLGASGARLRPLGWSECGRSLEGICFLCGNRFLYARDLILGFCCCLVVLRCSWPSSSWDSPSFIHGWGCALFAPCWQGVLVLRVTSGRLRYVDVVHQKWLSWLSSVSYMVDDCGAFCPRAYGLDPSGFCQAFFLASMVSLAADFAIDRIGIFG
ncbi:hypothetical protein Dimus_007623 [Dionaea muscipula]